MADREISMGRCAKCDAAIPDDAPAGWCPACLFREVLGSDDDPGAGPEGDDGRGDETSTPVTLGGYEVLDLIARGGMGLVHRARQVGLDRIVALKLLPGGEYASPKARERFRAEAQAVARLSHPGIVPVHEVGEHDGQLFYSMELVVDEFGEPAPTLAALAAAEPLPFDRAAAYVIDVARAVACAHRQGILHRDLKPSNILVDASDHARVTDFGLARSLEGGGPRTLTGHILGTPGYLAPEQVSKRHGPLTVATDVYALGAVLYCLLTGRPPIEPEADSVEALERAADLDPVPPRQLRPETPRDLEVICLRCLAKSPARRYAGATELAEDLERWRRGEPVLARPVSVAERWWWRARRRPGVTTLAAALVIVLGTGIPWLCVQRARGRDQLQRTERELVARTLRAAAARVTAGDVPSALHELAARLRELPRQTVLADRLVQLVDAQSFLVSVPLEQAPIHPQLGGELTQGVARSRDGVWTAWVTNQVDVVLRREVEPVGERRLRDVHATAIRSVSFSRDGRRWVTASADGTARLWTTVDGGLVAELVHPSPVQHAVFHPDGTRVATAGEDGRVRLWRPEGNRYESATLFARPKPVSCVRFSAGGTMLAYGTDDGWIGLWDVVGAMDATVSHWLGQPIVDVECTANPTGVRALAGEWGSCGFRVVRSHGLQELRRGDGQVVVGPRGRPAPEAWLRGLGLAEVATHLISADGRTLAVAEGPRVRMYETSGLQAIVESLLHPEPVKRLSFRADGRRLATATATGRVRVWDVATGQPVTEEDLGDGAVEDLYFDGTGRVLVIERGRHRRALELAMVSDPVPNWLTRLPDVLVGPPETTEVPPHPGAIWQRLWSRIAPGRGVPEVEVWAGALLGRDSAIGEGRAP